MRPSSFLPFAALLLGLCLALPPAPGRAQTTTPDPVAGLQAAPESAEPLPQPAALGEPETPAEQSLTPGSTPQEQAGGQTPLDLQHVRVSLVPENTFLRPDGSLWVAFEQTIVPGWHTYWENPGDSGTAPRVAWNLPEGLSVGPLLYPAPEKIATGPLASYGYHDRTVLLQQIRAAGNIPPGPLELSAKVEILVCQDICIPETDTLRLTLNAGSQEQAAQPAAGDADFVARARDALPETPVWPAAFSFDNGELVLSITPDDTAFAEQALAGSAELFPVAWGVVDNTAPARLFAGDQDQNSIVLRQRAGSRTLTEGDPLDVVVRFNLPDGSGRAVKISAIPARQAVLPGHADSAENNPAPAAAEAALSLPLPRAMLFALLGGLILNLMPCVFPILSMKALSSVKLSSKHPRIAAAHGLVYTAGILVTFSAIVIALLALRGAGDGIGWGFQLQDPLVVTLLAWLLFVIGLNLAGLFSLEGGRLTGIGGALAAGHGLSGSFFTGVLATLVATPCTAPFMSIAAGFALAQPAPVALTVFLFLGLGLALPFLLLSLAPALQRLLPRPGPWMETFRNFLAFPMFASSVWLVWVLSQQAGPEGVLIALTGMVALSFAIWIFRFSPGHAGARFLLRLLGALAVLAPLALLPMYGDTDAVVVPPPGQEATPAKVSPLNPAIAPAGVSKLRESWSPERLNQLLEGDDPVFVEMTAAWCITCKVNEKIALNDEATRKLFDEKGIHYLVGDWTNYDPDITAYLEGYGRGGVPIYVYYGARDKTSGRRPEPQVLPQLLTPAVVAGAIAKDPVINPPTHPVLKEETR